MKVWLITGASSGLGAALAQAVADHGDMVVATSRGGDGVRLDVTDESSIRGAVGPRARPPRPHRRAGQQRRLRPARRVRGVHRHELRDAFDTNLFGAMAVTRAVLPVMRAQGGGHIVQMSSVVGVTSGPGGTGYVAPKAALEAWSEALAAEVAHLDIKVTIVEPGPFRTDFSGRSLRVATPMDGLRAADRARPPRRSPPAHGTQPNDPYRGAQAIIAAVEAEHPPLRLPLGAEAFGWLRAYLTGRVDALSAAEELGGDTAFR